MLVLRVPIVSPDCAAVLLVALLVAEAPVVGAEVLLLPGDAELPHAASTTAAPARTGAAHHRLRISVTPFLVDLETVPRPHHVAAAQIVHFAGGQFAVRSAVGHTLAKPGQRQGIAIIDAPVRSVK